MTDAEVKPVLNKSETSSSAEGISRANVNRHNNDTKIIEFMQDLKEAIQNGEFQQYEDTCNAANETEAAELVGNSNLANIINVNNLSNQTFNYIINWLKQQQIQHIDEKVRANSVYLCK
jgi:hypothetical protein